MINRQLWSLLESAFVLTGPAGSLSCSVLSQLSLNATFTYYRTQFNESRSVAGPAEVLTQSSERIAIETDEDLSHFYIEISSIIVASENESDRAVYELEVYVVQDDIYCFTSNITVYAIERPDSIGEH